LGDPASPVILDRRRRAARATVGLHRLSLVGVAGGVSENDPLAWSKGRISREFSGKRVRKGHGSVSEGVLSGAGEGWRRPRNREWPCRCPGMTGRRSEFLSSRFSFLSGEGHIGMLSRL